MKKKKPLKIEFITDDNINKSIEKYLIDELSKDIAKNIKI